MKNVAKSIKNIPASGVYTRILDPNDKLDDVIEMMKAHWAYDLYTRKPGPALLDDGVLKPTDLDLACFLSALVDRNAVINIPKYELRRAATLRQGEYVVSKDNRHGHVLGLVSNKDVFSFSVRMKDMNVITTDGEGNDGVGAFRTFMLVDLNGDWYDGWKSIQFMPSRKENDFLEDKQLWTGNTVFFENFVHPNRWVSFYGKWYILTKILVARLRAEASARRAEVASKLAGGLAFPTSGDGALKEWGKSETVGESRSEIVNAFAAEVDAPVPEDYAPYENTQGGLIAARERATLLTYTEIPLLNFACRATELAFAKKAKSFSVFMEGSDEVVFPTPSEPFPAWISGASWDHAYKIKRTVWNRLVLHQSVPFAKGLALRYRVHKKTEKVAA
jgi:hypothetical protein